MTLCPRVRWHRSRITAQRVRIASPEVDLFAPIDLSGIIGWNRFLTVG